MDRLSESTWLERTLNRANDNRWAWFPLFALRPAQSEFVTPGMVVSVAICGFLPAAAICSVGMFFYAGWLGLWTTASVVAAACGFVFPLTGAVTYQYISAHYWNRRAARFHQASETPVQVDSEEGGGGGGVRPPFPDGGIEQVVSISGADSANPYRAPESCTISKDVRGYHPFPLCRLLYMHDVMFCHTSLLLFAAFCLWKRIMYGPLPDLAASYYQLAVISGLQGLLLVTLTFGLARRQTWLGRRTFFVLKLALGVAQLVICCLPSFARFLEATLMLWPIDVILRCWFAFGGVLTMWSACVQWLQPEYPVAPMFSRLPVSKDTGLNEIP